MGIIQFFKDYWSEIKKVSWPTWEELMKHTGMVIVVIVVFAAVTTLIDFGMKSAFEMLPAANAPMPSVSNTTVPTADVKAEAVPVTSSGAKTK